MEKSKLGYKIGTIYKSSASADIRLLDIFLYSIRKVQIKDELASAALHYSLAELERVRTKAKILQKRKTSSYMTTDYFGDRLELSLQGSFKHSTWYSIRLENVCLSDFSVKTLKKLLGKEEKIASLTLLLERLTAINAVELEYNTELSDFLPCLEQSKNLNLALHTNEKG